MELRMRQMVKRQEVTENAQYDKNTNSKLLDAGNELTSEAASVYMEIGLQVGVLLMKDMLNNIESHIDSEEPNYQFMYNVLFGDVTRALVHLQDKENPTIEKAVEILKSSQLATEEYFMKGAGERKKDFDMWI